MPISPASSGSERGPIPDAHRKSEGIVSRSLEFESRNERFTLIQAGSLGAIAVLVVLMVSSVFGGGPSASPGSPSTAGAARVGAQSTLQPGQVAALQTSPVAAAPSPSGSAVSSGQAVPNPQQQAAPSYAQPSTAGVTAAPSGAGIAAALPPHSRVTSSSAVGVAAPAPSNSRTVVAPVSQTPSTPGLSRTAGVAPTGQSVIGRLARSVATAQSASTGALSASAVATPALSPTDSTSTPAAGATTDTIPAAVPAGAVIGLDTGNYTPGGLLVGEGGFIGAGSWQQNVPHSGDLLAFGGFNGSAITYDVTTGQYVPTSTIVLGYDPTRGYIQQ